MMNLKNRGIFGSGMPQQPVGPTPPTPQTPGQAQTPQPKRWMEGGKFTTKDAIGLALGALGDAFGGNNNTAQAIHQAFAQRQQQAAEEQRYQRRRTDENADWQTREQWKRDNPSPTENDTVADYNFWKQTLAPDQFSTWLQNKINPPQYRQGPDGQFYRIETPAPAAPPPTFSDDDWNTGTPVGGAGSGQPGFRR